MSLIPSPPPNWIVEKREGLFRVVNNKDKTIVLGFNKKVELEEERMTRIADVLNYLDGVVVDIKDYNSE